MEEKIKHKTNQRKIVDIMLEAKENNMSYGQYIASDIYFKKKYKKMKFKGGTK